MNSLLSAVPNLDKLAVITGEQVANIGSQDMNDEVWLKLAKRVNAALADPGTDRVLITHGTDTLKETSYFLTLVTSSTQAGRDGGLDASCDRRQRGRPGDICDGVAVVTNPGAQGKGTLVVLDDEIHYAPTS